MMDLPLLQSGFGFEARAFFSETLLNDVLDGGANLYQVGRRHGFRFKRLSAH